MYLIYKIFTKVLLATNIQTLANCLIIKVFHIFVLFDFCSLKNFTVAYAIRQLFSQ